MARVTSLITKISLHESFWAFCLKLMLNSKTENLEIGQSNRGKEAQFDAEALCLCTVILKTGHKIENYTTTFFAGWTEPARRICSLFTSPTSSCRAPYFTLQWDRWFSTSPSSGSLFSPTCERRRNSKTKFALSSCFKTRVILGSHVKRVIVTLGGCFIASFILEFNRDLEKQRESTASNIAKKKQEAEAAVSIWLAYMFKSVLHEGLTLN